MMRPFIWRRFCLWLVLACALTGFGQERVAVAPYSTVQSPFFHLKPVDNIAVTGESNSLDFAVDLYVYDKEKILAGKDNEDSTSPLFTWAPSVEDDYYLQIRNLSAGSGSILISISRGRAIPPPGSPNYAQMRIFYATDRALTGQTVPNLTFGAEPDSQGQLHLGECTVSIPRDHKMGELEGPSIFRLEFSENPEKHVVLQSVEQETSSTFFGRIAGHTKHSEHKELMVFIHGFDNSFADAARRTAQISYDLGFDGAAILYSWPSQGEANPIAYNKDTRNAELTAPHLQQFLRDLVAGSGATTIHLIAHSMGNRPLTAAMQGIAKADKAKRPVLNQVVLMAPDIDSDMFKQLAQQICPAAHRITLYASSKDEALILSSKYAGGYLRAGQGGSNIVVIPGIDSIDASDVDTNALGLFHQYYADNSTILSDVFHVFKGEPAGARFGLRQKSTNAGAFWVFTPVAR